MLSKCKRLPKDGPSNVEIEFWIQHNKKCDMFIKNQKYILDYSLIRFESWIFGLPTISKLIFSIVHKLHKNTCYKIVLSCTKHGLLD